MEQFKKNKDLYNFFFQNKGDFNDSRVITTKILSAAGLDITKNNQSKILSFIRHLKARLTTCHHDKKFFEKKYCNWLNNEFKFLTKRTNANNENQSKNEKKQIELTKRETRKGRKEKSFNDCTDRQKRRRVDPFQNYSSEVLMYATKMKLRSEGNINASKILEYISTADPDELQRIRNYCEYPATEVEPYSKEEALALCIDGKLSKHQYGTLRFGAIARNSSLYPSYFQIQKAKLDCYPENRAITVTDSFAKIKLQDLLDHTIKRIFQSMPLKIAEPDNFILKTKWGCDGASGQRQYKQRFENSSDDDANIFLINIVPLELINEGTGCTVWENTTPSSTNYCRPVKFQFIKESTVLIKNEISAMQKEIEKLDTSKCCIDTTEVTVKHHLILSMIDGKVVNAICENKSSMTCYICNGKPTEMNQLENIYKKNVCKDYYKYGMSILHARIRSFECLLHIAYNLSFKSWYVKSAENKEKKKKEKERIQREFREKMGLNVDIVRQGAGTSNDGNTARKFFENPTMTAEITRLDENIIKRFAVILQAMASGCNINIAKFAQYTADTAKLYVELYGWYYMSATVHKILIHGSEIIKSFIVPIGKLSEEAQEARNKDFKRFRENNTRKCSREDTNIDLLHILLISSDPYISSLRNISKRSNKTFFLETMELLKIENPETLNKNDKEDDECFDDGSENEVNSL